MRFITGRFRLFKVDGINVYMHWSYLLIPVGTFFWFGWMRDRMRGASSVFGMLAVLAILAISLLFHEYCHCLAARRCTGQMRFSVT